MPFSILGLHGLMTTIDTQDIRICFIGDSFVNGTGDPEHLGWTGRVCALTQTTEIALTHYNLGIRGNTSNDIKERWRAECEIRLPAHSKNILVFSFGVNDTVYEEGHRRVELQQSIDFTTDIISQATKRFDILMVGPPPIDDADQNSRIQELDQNFNSICSKLTVPYLSIYQSLLYNPVWRSEVSSNDGAHPRSAGYAHLAHLVFSWDHWLKC